ncbi:MAG: hypothetical protein LAO79_07320 [Acidobacteriia bacterium]|nr:hypothetical protein [Terriglobia bacterium]
MVNATGNVQSAATLGLVPTTVTNSGTTLDSFAQQLSTALQQYFGQIESGANVQIDIQGGSSQTSGDRQFTVTVRDVAASDPPPSTAPAATALATSTDPAPSSSDTPAAIDKSNMTPTDAYWADQPAAVQALRDCPNDEKFSMAQDLAKQGYAIDMPIMVWGWDPLVTMTLRQQEGYTWVPSAFQPNIPIGPGITNVWNLPGYDPNNPPPGSIKVSTDFAIGSNGQDPWMKTVQAS